VCIEWLLSYIHSPPILPDRDKERDANKGIQLRCSMSIKDHFDKRKGLMIRWGTQILRYRPINYHVPIPTLVFQRICCSIVKLLPSYGHHQTNYRLLVHFGPQSARRSLGGYVTCDRLRKQPIQRD